MEYKNGKCYLYDIVDIKKKRSRPHELRLYGMKPHFLINIVHITQQYVNKKRVYFSYALILFNSSGTREGGFDLRSTPVVAKRSSTGPRATVGGKQKGKARGGFDLRSASVVAKRMSPGHPATSPPRESVRGGFDLRSASVGAKPRSPGPRAPSPPREPAAESRIPIYDLEQNKKRNPFRNSSFRLFVARGGFEPSTPRV